MRVDGVEGRWRGFCFIRVKVSPRGNQEVVENKGVRIFGCIDVWQRDGFVVCK
jgi:hypothetical protein